MFAFQEKKTAVNGTRQSKQKNITSPQKTDLCRNMALAYTCERDGQMASGQEKSRLCNENMWNHLDVMQFAKYGDITKVYLKADSFDSLIRYYINYPIEGDGWRSLKEIYCQELFKDQDEFELDAALKRKIVEDINRLNGLCRLYRELARVRVYRDPSQAAQIQWLRNDGTATREAGDFIQSYINKFGNAEEVTKYKSAIEYVINSENYDAINEIQYSYNRSERRIERGTEEQRHVIYRAMKKEEYEYLLQYFKKMKKFVDERYESGEVKQKEIREINAEFTKCGFSENKLPIASHIGDFGQVTNYLKKSGEAERVIVKFYIRKDKINNMISDVTAPPSRGGEGKIETNKNNHIEDKIGTKLEADTFSYNLSTSKWAAFKFLYFVESIEVINSYMVSHDEMPPEDETPRL